MFLRCGLELVSYGAWSKSILDDHGTCPPRSYKDLKSWMIILVSVGRFTGSPPVADAYHTQLPTLQALTKMALARGRQAPR